MKCWCHEKHVGNFIPITNGNLLTWLIELKYLTHTHPEPCVSTDRKWTNGFAKQIVWYTYILVFSFSFKNTPMTKSLWRTWIIILELRSTNIWFNNTCAIHAYEAKLKANWYLSNEVLFVIRILFVGIITISVGQINASH